MIGNESSGIEILKYCDIEEATGWFSTFSCFLPQVLSRNFLDFLWLSFHYLFFRSCSNRCPLGLSKFLKQAPKVLVPRLMSHTFCISVINWAVSSLREYFRRVKSNQDIYIYTLWHWNVIFKWIIRLRVEMGSRKKIAEQWSGRPSHQISCHVTETHLPRRQVWHTHNLPEPWSESRIAVIGHVD